MRETLYMYLGTKNKSLKRKNSGGPQMHTTLKIRSWMWWPRPVISGTQEAEIGRIEIQDQPGKTINKTPSQQIMHR
jgi:hypothetical protein